MKEDSVLALAMRPKSLEELIGAEKLAAKLRKRFESGRIPRAIMLVGETGGGKTTVARVIARSIQCHHEEFGKYCSKCWHRRKMFDIDETNAAKVRGVDQVESKVSSYDLYPLPGSRYRVYIFDEAQQLSDHAQNLLLKYTEDCPKTTMFIFTTTEEESIIRTLRRRCRTYSLPSLEFSDVKHLVKRALHRVGSDLSSAELVEKLWEKEITSPGLILNAVESFLDGDSPDAASEVETTSGVKTKSICRQMIKGDWESISSQLRKMKPEDVQAIQGATARYLMGILVSEAADYTSRTKIVSQSIMELSRISGSQSKKVQMSALCAVLYDVCRYFRRYPH